MQTPRPHLPALPSRKDAEALLARLRELQGQRGQWLPLQGKFVALMCISDESATAQRFRRAANELGARVAWMHPSLDSSSSAELIQATARVLGRLYDAVECQELDADLVDQLRSGSGVPVFDALAAPRMSDLALLKMLEEAGVSTDRHGLLQARLLNALA